MPKLQIDNLIIKEKNNTLVDLTNQLNKKLVIENSLALVGQSGSGKSLTLKAILNMIPSNLDVDFKYESDFELNKNNIAFIPQNPFTSLSPMTKINKQFFCDDKKIDNLLSKVKLETNLKDKFPIELSGGQLQRIIIAIALNKNPKVILLDEPTTALDDSSKQNILDIFIQLQKDLNFVMIYVSHDINSIKDICQDIAILKDGIICEMGDTKIILENPQHSYTKELIESNFKNREFRV